MERIYTCKLTKEHIRNIFNSNYMFREILCDVHSEWKLSNYNNWNTEHFVKDVWCIMERNGYTYSFKRCSKNPDNVNLYDAIEYIDLEKDNVYVCSVSGVRYESMLEQLIIKVITEHLIKIEH